MNSLNSTKKSLRNSLIIIAFNLIYLVNLNFAQVNPDINFYPLHVDDTWQYFVEYDSHFDYEDTTYYTQKRVVGLDTLEGKVYYIVDGSSHASLNSDRQIYLRIDSSSATVLQYWNETEILSDSLSSKKNDRFDKNGHDVVCIEDTVLGFFDEERRVKTYWEMIVVISGRGGSTYNYAYDLGCIEYSWPEANVAGATGNASLVYAKIDGKEYGTYVDVAQSDNPLPTDYKLKQNYPNPFNPSTKIVYSIGNTGNQGDIRTTLIIYDSLGKEITTLVNERKSSGEYEVEFNAAHLSSGVYFYKLTAGNFSSVKKMLLIR